MDDKKYSFSNVTLRIYGEDLLRIASETFKKTENQFANSKSAFVLYYFQKGLYADVKNDGGNDESNALVIAEVRELKKSIDSLLSYLKAEKESSIKNTKSQVEVQGTIEDSLAKILSALSSDRVPQAGN